MKNKKISLSSQIKTLRRGFVILFILTALVPLITPHIIKGETYINEDFEQSLVILIDGIVAYGFYFFYRHKISMLVAKHENIERQLVDTYRHIGKVNSELDLVKNFIALSPKVGINKNEEKKVFTVLLSYIIKSVAKANSGFVRFVDIEKGKTIKEFAFNENGNMLFAPRISNTLVIDGDYGETMDGEVAIHESYYQESRIRCIICFPKIKSQIDATLIKLLVTQMHLLFLANYTRSLGGYGSRCYI